jgi:nucleotidyltransferase substrate binding protein (TIGR01987 family)
MNEEIRWKQRFENFQRALQILHRAVELAAQRELSELEQQGLVHIFEFTHELAWNVLKDYLDEQGITGIIGSKNATRSGVKNGLLADGEAWIEMIRARNLSSHTYNLETAAEIADMILTRFYPAFMQMTGTFSSLAMQSGKE